MSAWSSGAAPRRTPLKGHPCKGPWLRLHFPEWLRAPHPPGWAQPSVPSSSPSGLTHLSVVNYRRATGSSTGPCAWRRGCLPTGKTQARGDQAAAPPASAHLPLAAEAGSLAALPGALEEQGPSKVRCTQPPGLQRLASAAPRPRRGQPGHASHTTHHPRRPHGFPSNLAPRFLPLCFCPTVALVGTPSLVLWSAPRLRRLQGLSPATHPRRPSVVSAQGISGHPKPLSSHHPDPCSPPAYAQQPGQLWVPKRGDALMTHGPLRLRRRTAALACWLLGMPQPCDSYPPNPMPFLKRSSPDSQNTAPRAPLSSSPLRASI